MFSTDEDKEVASEMAQSLFGEHRNGRVWLKDGM